MPACVIAGDVIVGELSTALPDRHRCRLDRFGQAEVQHLHRAVAA